MSDRIDWIYRTAPAWLWEVPSEALLALLILFVGLLNYIRLRMIYSELERFDKNQKTIWLELKNMKADQTEKMARLLTHMRLEIKRVARAVTVFKSKG